MLRPVTVRQHPYTRLFRLRSRGSLIAATVVLQALVVGAGWWATMHIARSGLASRVRERVTDENSRAAASLSAALTNLAPGPLHDTNEAREDAQKLVESYRLPGRSALAIVDADGRVMCKDDAMSVPDAAGRSLARLPLTLLPGRETIALGDLNPGAVVTAEADLFGAPVTLAVLYNNAARAKIIAYQPRTAVDAAEKRILGGLLFWGGLAGALVLAITALGSAVLVRRYDTMLMRLNTSLESEVARRTRRGLDIRNALIFGLAKLADYRDTDTGSHLERICRYCDLLATPLIGSCPDVDRAWVERLRLASSMHDIGKVGIPDSILLKPGPLTPSERRQMETHAQIGADTLAAIRERVGDDDLLAMSVEVALCHHEKFDGTGYPNRIAGEAIPLSARIVALADIYDALTSKRVYKDAVGHEEARRIILASSGTHLDPAVVAAFEAHHEAFEAVRRELQPAHAETPALALAVRRAEEARKAA